MEKEIKSISKKNKFLFISDDKEKNYQLCAKSKCND